MSSADLSIGTLHSLVLILGPGLPLALSMGLLIRSWQPAIIRLTPWTALPALFASLLMPPGIQLKLPWLLFQARLGIDATGQVFLFFTALLWLVAGAYARSYMKKDSRRGEFFGFYLLAMSGNLGLILAQDMLSFYLFFALMSFLSYGLVVYNRNPEARRAGRVYIYLVVLGEVLVFSALVMIAKAAGSLSLERVAHTPLNNTVTGLVLLGFGIKAGAVPLHVWLPLAHPEAPTPASAVLSGAMIKAGLLGWLRFLPFGLVAQPEWGVLCVAGGLLATFYGVLIGLTQTNPKTVLAYSSISQMGYMTVGVGLGLLLPAAWPLALSAILIYALHHALAKGALFLGVGVAAAVSPDSRRAQLVAAGLLLPALAMAGGPLTSGTVAKAALKSAAVAAPFPWAGWLSLLLPVGAVGTTLLMGRFLIVVWPKPSGHARLTSGLWLPWAVLLGFVAASVWLWPAAAAAAWKVLSPFKLWGALWPVALGALSVWGVLTLVRKTGTKIGFQVPSGDLLLMAEWLTRVFARDSYRNSKANVTRFLLLIAKLPERCVRRLRFSYDLLQLEARLGRWTTVGTLFLFVTIALFLFLLGFPLFP